MGHRSCKSIFQEDELLFIHSFVRMEENDVTENWNIVGESQTAVHSFRMSNMR